MKRSRRQSHVLADAQTPAVVGSGLLALDIVLSELSGAPPSYWAGGTCGNVLIALRYLGWESQPVARLRPGAAADRILADLKRWDVSEQFISLADDGSTPVIVERITRGSGDVPRHSFSWRCPECSSQFPAFKPVLTAVAEEIAAKLERVQVYFFDRPTPGGIALARAAAQNGALVVFEPSNIGNPVLFRQAWDTSHVVKYSHERLSELPEIGVEGAPRLQVETLGEAGLRYRHVSQNGRTGRWVEMKAFSVESIRDTAGSGDWCTAGFIDRAGRGGAKGFHKLRNVDLIDAFRYGQALAAWNCGYEGARGGMYSVDHQTFVQQTQKILEGQGDRHVSIPTQPADHGSSIGAICPVCVKIDTARSATGTTGSEG
jgi:sugar/nucleoside kinase (ribokinase family)